jgi:hypothetical protein
MHKIMYMTIVLTLSFGLLLETIGSSTSVFAQANQTTAAANQTDGSNITSSADTISDNATTTAERFENITHGGGAGGGATNQSSR